MASKIVCNADGGTSLGVKDHDIKLFGRTPRVDIFVNELPVKAIADCGAEVSLVTLQWYRQMLLPQEVVIHGTDFWVTAANGAEISCIGYVITDLRVENQVIKNCGLFVTEVPEHEGVVQGVDVPILLGMNVLAELVEGWRGLLGRTSVSQFKGKWEKCVRAVEARLDLMQQSTLGLAVVRQQQNLTIPAGSRRVIQIYIPSLSRIETDSVLLEPLETSDGYWVPEGVCVFPSYTQVHRGCGWVAVANLGRVDVVLHPQWKIAKAAVGRVLKQAGVGSAVCTVESDISPEVAREFREKSGVHVDEGIVDPQYIQQLDRLLYKYRAVFAEDSSELGCASGVEHEIHLSTSVPIKLPYRHIPPTQIPEVKAHVKGLLEQGVIEESVSPYAAPIVLVRKKDGSLRLCVDYRRLNSVTVKDAFPLPRIQDTLDALAGAQYFSSFDLAAGYHQIKVRAEDRFKTAFVTPFGHYQYIRCPMGLTNSPATFQRFMEYVFSDYIFITLLIYLDDILVFSRTLGEHLERLETVFQRLQKYGLKLKPSKCHLLKPEVRYLGFIVSQEGIKSDPEKIKAVQEWPRPKTVRELRGFVAFCGFYRRFIENFAKTAAPLHALMGGKSTADITKYWGAEEERAFAELKNKFSQPPVLKSADYSKPFVVETDASMEGLGAVLSQDYEGRLHPVAYASRGLRKTERNMNNYSSRKLELLALKWAVTEQFKHYLIGSKFIVYTDNNPLAHLEASKLGAVESRWLGDLSHFDFVIKYRPGKENANADGLSRKAHKEEIEDGSEVYEMWEGRKTNLLGRQVSALGIWKKQTEEQMCDAQKSCSVLGYLWKQMTGKLSRQEFKMAMEMKEFRQLWRLRRSFVMRGGIIYWNRGTRMRSKWKPVLPLLNREEIMKAAHEQWGHQGVARTSSLIRNRCFWPGLYDDVSRHVAQCKVCAMGKEEGIRAKTKLGTVEASRPWEVLAMDFTLLDPSRDGKENVLVITDVFSKYSFAFATKNQRAGTVAKILVEEIFNRFGIPEKLHSDQGRNFESRLVQELCTYYHVEKSRTSAYHPEGNGGCERFNRTLHGMLTTLGSEQRQQWPRYLASLTAIYNSTPHPVTGFSPHYLIFGTEPNLPLDRFSLSKTKPMDSAYQWIRQLKEVQSTAWEAAKKHAEEYRRGNRKRRQGLVVSETLKVGQRVLLRNHGALGRCKIKPKYTEDVWVVSEVLDDYSGVYRVEPEQGHGESRILHRSNLRPWNGSVSEGEGQMQSLEENDAERGEGLILDDGDRSLGIRALPEEPEIRENVDRPVQPPSMECKVGTSKKGDIDSESGYVNSQDDIEMPDMEKVLKRFGVEVDCDQSSEGETAQGSDINVVHEQECLSEDPREEIRGGVTNEDEWVEGGIQTEPKNEVKKEDLPLPRRSKRIARQGGLKRKLCIGCGDCVRGDTHKN